MHNILYKRWGVTTLSTLLLETLLETFSCASSMPEKENMGSGIREHSTNGSLNSGQAGSFRPSGEPQPMPEAEVRSAHDSFPGGDPFQQRWNLDSSRGMYYNGARMDELRHSASNQPLSESRSGTVYALNRPTHQINPMVEGQLQAMGVNDPTRAHIQNRLTNMTTAKQENFLRLISQPRPAPSLIDQLQNAAGIGINTEVQRMLSSCENANIGAD